MAKKQKTGSSRKPDKQRRKPTQQRYTAEKRWTKNKARKQEIHQRKAIEQQPKALERKELVQQCISKFSIKRGTYALKRLIGTLNTRRLKDFLSGEIVTKDWFTNREIPSKVHKLVSNSSIPKEYIEATA
jgi:hypothetical protein